MNQITLLLASILLFGIAYFIGMKGHIEFLHSYHRKYVKQKDIKAYTQGIALSLCIIAIDFLLYIAADLLFAITSIWIIGIGFCLAMIVFIHIQYKYNGSIFSLRKPTHD